MANVVFFIPGNFFSSQLTGVRAEKMYNEKFGLEAIGKSGFPVATCNHGIDIMIYPWLRETCSKHKNIETLSSTFGHSLTSLLNKPERNFEINNGTKGNINVAFFPDYSVPRPNTFEEKYFLYLGDQTVNYNLGLYGVNIKKNPGYYQGDQIVNYDGKIGIPVDGYSEFLSAWHAHAATPNKENLSSLILEFEQICLDDSREFVIIPINLEQPFIGSVLGAKLWTIFFSELTKSQYKNKVVPLSSVLYYCQHVAVKKRPPERIYTKWFNFSTQIMAQCEMARVEMPNDSKKYYFSSIIRSIAGTAGYLSSLGRKNAFSVENRPFIMCSYLDGKPCRMDQGSNLELEDICRTARSSLINEQSFSKTLEKFSGNFLVESIGRLASDLGI